MCDEVDIFGLGNVSPCFVWGVEMSEEMIDKITKEGEKMREKMEAERLAKRGPRAEGEDIFGRLNE